jgi:acyl-homoserine-lactone acylase
MRYGLMAAVACGALLAAVPAMAKPRYEAQIVRTQFGIPHITAKDWQGIGYGVAYAYAQDNFCLLAEEFVTVAGERSRWFGPEGKVTPAFQPIDNLSSDIFFRSAIDLPALRAGAKKQSRETLMLAAGYVAGYNRYLRDAGKAGLPAECRDKPWVRPITADDTLRLTEKTMLLASSVNLATAIANASPPTAAPAKVSATLPRTDELGIGSNGWAFGGDVTANGRGMVIGNPHFPWFGPNRFWEMHVTIPGKIDAMGVGIAGTPVPTLGFNKDIAWTHTVTAARHFAFYQLKLDPADPTAYLVDGKPEKMTARAITVPMPAGKPPVVRTVYSTRFGPVVAMDGVGMKWDTSTAFAIRDLNLGNQRAIDSWVAIARARNVGEIRDAVTRSLGIPWVNAIAADRYGNALHTDVTPVPNVSATLAKDCATPLSALVASQAVLLDGSRATCALPGNGLLPAAEQAIYGRRDYVTNSNDSYWLSNPRAPYRELAPPMGKHAKAISLRTRSNFIETDAALAAGKMDHARAEALVFGNKSLAADLALTPLLALCEGKAEVARACAALKGWDRRFDLGSRGAEFFGRFWDRVQADAGLWSVPFDPANPVSTPRDLVTSGAMGAELLKAMADTTGEFDKAGLALDARLGSQQFAPRGDDRIPIHGGPGTAGVLNVQQVRPIAGGFEPFHGSSYIQVVGFDEKGPVADAILSYSQSTDPASPHYGDQTRAYSAKRWHRLPFTPAEIAADAIGKPLTISE